MVGEGGFAEEAEVGVAFVDQAFGAVYFVVEVLDDHAAGAADSRDVDLDAQGADVGVDGHELFGIAAEVAER